MRNCGSHIGQAKQADEVYGVDFGENWVSVDPSVDYDKTLASIHRTVEGYPGLYRDVQTYLRERIKEVLTGHERVDRRAHLRSRSRGPAGEGRRDPSKDRRTSTASSTRTRTSRTTCRTSRSSSTSPRRGATGSSPATSAARPPRCWPARRSSDLSYAGQAYDVHVWSIPSARNSVTDVERLPIDTPNGGRVRARARSPTCGIAPTPNAIEREQQSRRIDVGANVEGRDLGSVVDEVEERLRRSSSRAPTTPRCSASRPS